MGYYRHEAIVVMAWVDTELPKAHDKACAIFENELVSEIVEGTRNVFNSFFIAPDGSKLWWSEETKRERQRNKFLTWLKTQGSAFIWVHVCLYDDFGKPRLLGANCDDPV